MHRNFSYFSAADGRKIRYGIWRTHHPEFRGSIVCLAGRAEFIEKNAETTGELLDRGFDVYSLDWRGQGLSDRLLGDRHKGYVDNYSDYVEDLVHFIDHFVRPQAGPPLILLAHSMGGHIALRYLHDHPEQFDRAVLLSPMIDITTSPMPKNLVRTLARIAVWAGMGAHYIMGAGRYDPNKKFADNPLTGDRQRFFEESGNIEEQPDLALGGVTYRWLFESLASVDRLQAPDFAAAISTPVLMLSGDQDRVVCRTAQRRFCRMLPNCRFVEIQEARHEILKETDAIRNQFWKHFDAFVR